MLIEITWYLSISDDAGWGALRSWFTRRSLALSLRPMILAILCYRPFSAANASITRSNSVHMKMHHVWLIVWTQNTFNFIRACYSPTGTEVHAIWSACYCHITPTSDLNIGHLSLLSYPLQDELRAMCSRQCDEWRAGRYHDWWCLLPWGPE